MTKYNRVRDILREMSGGEERPEVGWPWLPLDRPATKKEANKFMFGAIIDYQIPANRAWENARIFTEEILGDPDNLWNIITGKTEDWMIHTFTKHSLHRFVNKVPVRVLRIAHSIVEEYDGDARNIWKEQSSDEIVRRLRYIRAGNDISDMIRGALEDTGHIREERGRIKADINTKRVLGRVFDGDGEISVTRAQELASQIEPDNPWKIDRPLYYHGLDVCTKQDPGCNNCKLSNECRYNS